MREPAPRVLAVIPAVADTVFGGAEIQARCTAAALGELGVTADVCVTDEPDARGYDVAHIFGSNDPAALSKAITMCRVAGAGVAVSPIWRSWREVSARALRELDVLKRQRSHARTLRDLADVRSAPVSRLLSRRDLREFDALEASQAEALARADVLCVLSAGEARELRLLLGVRSVPFMVARNAIRWEALPELWPVTRSGVVCAARIEPGKNQHMLAWALRDLDVEVTFAGETSDERYLDLVRSLAGPRAKYVGRLETEELMALFARSAVHALPSWADLASLSHLEAAACGARVVIGDRGSEWEYFEGDAWYVDPGDAEGMRLAVSAALRADARTQSDRLDKRLHRFTWQRCAQDTLRAYRLVLDRPNVAA